MVDHTHNIIYAESGDGDFWTAACKTCGESWTSRDENIPADVLELVKMAHDLIYGRE